MNLISRLEDLVIEVDTEYQKKMEAVIREIVPGMPEDSVCHAAECMCTDRMGSMIGNAKTFRKRICLSMRKR